MVKQTDRLTLGQLRRTKGATQRDIADAMGMTVKAVSGWETGASEPHLTPMQTLKVMQLYGCLTIEEFVDAVDASMQDRQKKIEAKNKKSLKP